MRIRSSIAAAILLTLCMPLLSGCSQRNFAGTWTGTVSFKMGPTDQAVTLPLTFHVTKTDDGKYTSTVDITSLKAMGLPVQSFVVDGDKVTMTIQSGTGSFSFNGTTNSAATEITGTMGQGSDSSPLKLTKTPDAK